MAEDPTIDGHSRWFRLAVLLSVIFVLFATMLAVGAVDTPSSGVPIPGQGDKTASAGDGEPKPTDANDSSDVEEKEPTAEDADSKDDETASEGGVSSYGGISSGGYPEQSTVGGKIGLSNRAELRVESPQPARWRLGGYDQYTGSGWERDSNPEPLRDPLETADSESPRPQYEIRAEALRPFKSLAAVWRPAFAGSNRDVFVTDQQGLVVDGQLETNETYTTVTYGPPSRSDAKTATGSAPPTIRDQYTQLPLDTPDRLGEKTAEITADAETPYEAAETVERWLKQNKEYTLNASHDRENDVATEFVFEMDAGYCQYFATAMTAMLRTQDIPTRYVTGYTTGEQVGENTYLARGKNAHAWVEVYFEDVGWVTFDPTPGDGRVDAGRSVQQQDESSEQDQPDSDDEEDEQESDDSKEDESPPEDSDQNEQDEESEQDDTDEEIPGPPYDIELSPDPVPGAEVTVTVEKNDTAVAGVEVSFNGEVVGTTDNAGQLTATVPYTSELIVSAAPPPEQRSTTAQMRPVAGGSDMTGGGRLFAPLSTPQTDENSSVRYEIPTTVAVETEELVLPGRSIAANMSINGSAVADLDVLVDGETVDTTGEDGEFTLPVPADAPLDENLTVRFTRDEFLAEGPVTVADVVIEVETGLLKLPGDSADVTVTAVEGDQEVPLEEVPIRTNGGEATTVTDADGAAALTLPWSNEATATAVVGEQTVTASVSGILLHLLGVLSIPVVTLVGGGIWVYRNPQRVRRFKRRVVGALITAGNYLRIIGHWVYAAVFALARTLRNLASRVRNYFSRLRDGITLPVLLSPAYYLIARLTGLVGWILALPGRIQDLLSSGSSDQSQTDGPGPESTDSAGSTDANREVPAYRRLKECWYWLVRRVVRRSRTKTAVEVEKQAVEKGFPRRPVRRLRRAFQDVEYGYADPTERVDTAEESVDQLRDDPEEREQ